MDKAVVKEDCEAVGGGSAAIIDAVREFKGSGKD